ncbi:hypothetical protein MnTg02_02904 [bacterium MnTg02]|nr:hypothetical protein MnTg02_02904 [bacterium MnTg02]
MRGWAAALYSGGALRKIVRASQERCAANETDTFRDILPRKPHIFQWVSAAPAALTLVWRRSIVPRLYRDPAGLRWGQLKDRDYGQ